MAAHLWKPLLEQFRSIRTLSELSEFDTEVYYCWKRRQINDVEFMSMQRLINSKKKSLSKYGGNQT